MTTRDRLSLLADAMSTHGFTVDTSPLESCDVCATTNSTLAFFRLIDDPSHIIAAWHSAQLEIARHLDVRYPEGSLPDSYLILLSTHLLDPQELSLQTLLNDPYVCRKVVLQWVGRDLQDILPTLPFWPVSLPERAVQEVPPPAVAMSHRGYDAQWVDSLSQRVGAETLARQLLSGSQTIVSSSETLPPKQHGMNARRQRSQRWRIGSLQLQGFRVFGRPVRLNLDASLVVVYGRNGTGKTSLCEGLEWALTGDVARFRDQSADTADADEPLLNLAAAEARAELSLLSRSTARSVVRSLSATGDRRCLVDKKDISTQAESIAEILGARLPEREHITRLRDTFRRYHVLDQATSLEFLRIMDPHDRYQALRPMVGTAEYGFAASKLGKVKDYLLSKSAEAQATEAALRARLVTRMEVHAQLAKQREALLRKLGDQDPAHLYDHIQSRAAEVGIVWRGHSSADPDMVETLAEMLTNLLPAQLEDAKGRLEDLASLQRSFQAKTAWMSRYEDMIRNQRGIQETQSRLRSEWNDTTAQRNHAEAERVHEEALLVETDQQLALYARRESLREDWKQLHGRIAEVNGLLALAERTLAERRKLTRMAEEQSDQVAQRALDTSGALRRQKTILNQVEAARSATQSLERLMVLVPEVQATLSRAMSTHAQLELDQREAAIARGQWEMKRQHADAALAALRSSSSERQRLIAALQTHIDSANCPLCTWHWKSKEDLQEAVKRALTVAPPELAALQAQRSEADLQIAQIVSAAAARDAQVSSLATVVDESRLLLT